MTIRKKLLGWFLVPITLIVIIGIVISSNSRKIDENIQTLIKEDWVRADSNMELRIGLGLLERSMAKMHGSYDYEDIGLNEKAKEAIRDADKTFKLGKDKFEHGFEKLVELEKKGPDIFKLKYTTAEVRQRYDIIISSLDRMRKEFLAGDVMASLTIKEKEFDPHLLELQETVLEEAEEFADAIVENSEKTVKQFTAKNNKASIYLAIIAVFVGIVYSIIISRVISKPITKLKNAAIKIGKSKYDEKIEIKSKDEIGQLADSFRTMIINLREFRDNLEQSEEKYRDLTENSSELIYQTDKERFFVEVNRTMLKKLGYRPEEIKAMRVEDIVPANKREAMVKHVQKTIEMGNDYIETIFLKKNREELYVGINARLVYDSNNDFNKITGYARDITANRRVKVAEKQKKDLQILASQIISVQEEERRRISRELHDEAGQSLMAMNINLEMMEKEIPANSLKIRERLIETKNLLASALKEIRSLTFELRSPLLEYYGILVAIKAYSKKFSERTNINVKVYDTNIVKRFPLEIETLFYRCTQEALTNVAKHSEAKNVKIDVIRENGNLRMNIKDDGKGFNANMYFEESMNSSSIGLFGMSERIILMGGKLRIHSEKNKGTVLEILVPIKD